MAYDIAVDIGGTFTDCIVVDEDGGRTVSKALTTYGSLATGVLDALDVAAQQLGTTRSLLLGGTRRFVHGTTQATNAMVTRTGGKTGLITTRGHEDTLVIGRAYIKVAGLGERDVIHASRLSKPEPLVPRSLTRGVTERVDAYGDVLVPLDEDEVRAAVRELVAEGVDAIAVSLLWSFLDDAHERRIAEIARELAPDVMLSLSHEVAPVMGEFERAATTAVNAYIGPTVIGYLRDLEDRLRRDGLARPMLVMQAGGGVTSVEEARAKPIVTLDSGPAGGALGCLHLGRLYDEPNVICTDVGGTTFDVSVIRDGRLPLTEEPVVERYTLRLPKIDVEPIGAGGGSIAWIDEGGMLQVGPQSARSMPGPACYGRGGTEPTVTDADLVLGLLDPDAFLGGRMRLDLDAARRALASLGDRLGMTADEVALGIFRIVNAQMADQINRATIARGHDPRECVIVAYGGAAPTHAAFYGEDIGAKSILVPAESTVFSAEGMLTCDLTHSATRSRTFDWPLGEDDIELLESGLHELSGRVTEQFAREGVDTSEIRIERSAGVRYRNQFISLDVPLPTRALDSASLEAMYADFSREYSSLYGPASLLEGSPIEIDQHRIVGVRRIEPVPFPAFDLSDPDPSAALLGERPALFPLRGRVTTPVYDGEVIRPGHAFTGPAIIQRPGDSVVIPPGFAAHVDRYRTIVLTRQEDPS
ncbi:hydantoinase/oxoprolinase family protein [Microbacterium album]|uniref:5-oxoprolinase n=1 Tax=Microbacterium album TaxID=2053191 RepID=A0A917IAQ8_9MICO|nr:hydantoinase/oxoprolinase family protein [Microbacterium album]GGH33531.1 5-oxoprolinase [Microbacterium album]